jgi:hypothetical protein
VLARGATPADYATLVEALRDGPLCASSVVHRTSPASRCRPVPRCATTSRRTPCATSTRPRRPLPSRLGETSPPPAPIAPAPRPAGRPAMGRPACDHRAAPYTTTSLRACTPWPCPRAAGADAPAVDRLLADRDAAGDMAAAGGPT